MLSICQRLIFDAFIFIILTDLQNNHLEEVLLQSELPKDTIWKMLYVTWKIFYLLP